MGMRPIALLIALLTASISHAAEFVAHFDTMSEGDVHVSSMLSDGISFYQLDQNLSGSNQVFTVEAADSADLGPSFTGPNVITFGGYVPGPGVSFGRVKSFNIGLQSPSWEMTGIDLDVWTLMPSSTGNQVVLEAWSEDALLSSTSFVPAGFTIDHRHLNLALDSVHHFALRGVGTHDNGVVFLNLDNVRITASPVPEPATWAGFGLGLLTLRSRISRSRGS